VSENQTYGIREIANWILDYADSRGLEVTNMSLNKLAYFAYERALVNHGRKLTNAKIEAWDHGPVFREIYRCFKEFGNKPITSRATLYKPELDRIEVVEPKISSDDAEIILSAVKDLVRLPASVLREISHGTGGPWDVVWNHEGRTNPGMQISDEIIKTHSCGRAVIQ
jgi:uncharacterized phage-associated protein